MRSKPLGDFLPAVSVESLLVPAGQTPADILINGLEFDSRRTGPGILFFALEGLHTDGHQFLDDVWQRGCRAAVVRRIPENPVPDFCYIQVADTRSALSPLSAAFYDHPSRQIPVIGVTGTDGKSSTVSFIYQLLEAAGHPSGFFSTVQWKSGDRVMHNEYRQSTPEAPQIHAILREMIDHGKEYAVLESTSHGLSPKTGRLTDVCYTCAVFTNVTLEHLEFHGTVENYRRDKARLFEALARGPEGAFGVVNKDDPHHEMFVQAAGNKPVLTYSLKDPGADLYAVQARETPAGLQLTLRWKQKEAQACLKLSGLFNAENLMAALLAVSGVLPDKPSPLDLLPWAENLVPVKGRMCAVDGGQPFRVLVDYAHTPGAFEKLLPAVRATTEGRLILVFGSGGERDHEKRPLQGALADRYADIVVLTDEDPRLEGSWPIIDGIAEGITGKKLGQSLFKTVPRREAVRQALNLARAGDTVLLLGKGHEQTIVTAKGSEPYDEETTARELLGDLGWHR